MNVHLEAFRSLLSDLGFETPSETGPGTIVEGSVVRGGETVARFRFHQYRAGERVSLTVTPSDPDRATVMAGSGSIHPDHVDRALAEISMLMRARLVLDGDLPYERLPDGRHLAAWASRVDARIGLASDRSNRRATTATGAEAKSLVAGLRRALRAGPDHEALLAVHCDCCLVEPGEDPVLRYLRESASTDALMGSLETTWETGSALAPIAHGSARFVPDEPRRRLADVPQDEAAPRPF